PLPVKLICGLLYKEEKWCKQALTDLETEFGEIDYQSNPLEFHFTDYYFKEMGQPLMRRFISFSRLVDPADLAVIKVWTNSLEEKYSQLDTEKRVLNIDPGYLNLTAFILATSKNYAHRIYLGKGVFAQQELLFERRKIQTLDWTYPDYRSYEYQEILKKIREIYANQLKMKSDRNFSSFTVSKIHESS
ncbi:DUF4416 family protein, partial [bacterium]|nr:DUF4416 family protein [bacterium]